MKILYVGKHNNPRSNDDEGAIAYVLRQLGHTVDCIHQSRFSPPGEQYDFVLFHKWDNTKALEAIEAPKVFWYFDLVEFPDNAQERQLRNDWMRRTIPVVDIGFCTDGDWVARDDTGKLVWLPQGADNRFLGLAGGSHSAIPILFTGGIYGIKAREASIQALKDRYDGKFRHIAKGYYQRNLAGLIGKATIVVSPEAPASNRYWSNRVYGALGYGAFLIHPYCSLLASQYEDGKEIVYYRSREEFHRKINYYLEHPAECVPIRAAGFARTVREHTYRHRVEQLLKIVGDRLCL